MTAENLRILFEYNSWANSRMLDALSELPPSVYVVDRKSSHGGLHGTMVHIVSAQYIWLLRWAGKPPQAALDAAGATGSLEALRRLWERVQAETAAFLDERLDDALPGQSFTMKTSKGIPYPQTYSDTMQHLINHSTYHRGQVAALMRQEGISPPSTDFIRFIRERGEGNR